MYSLVNIVSVDWIFVQISISLQVKAGQKTLNKFRTIAKQGPWRFDLQCLKEKKFQHLFNSGIKFKPTQKNEIRL